ncbi:MAG TPA: diguanylate cyclase [Acidimicrobiales bacterium]|nr:diguanylate cyclase [Acidimicrobiales bacterium]
MARMITELPDATIVIDAQGRVKWANRAAEGLFGQPLDDAVGMSGLDLVHPQDLEFVLLSLMSVHSKEIGSPIEVRLATPAGWCLVELIGAPVPWFEDGAVLLSLRDLTERRRFELAHDHDARSRSLVQNSAAVTMLVSPDGTIESVSGALTRVLGHDPEMIEGRPFASLVNAEDRSTLEAAVKRATGGAPAADPVKVRLSLLHRKGEAVPFELALVNLMDDPTVGGYVVSGHEVTAQVLAELELRNALSLLRATLDSTADGIVVVDRTGRMVSFNRRFAEMWGLSDSAAEQGAIRGVRSFFSDRLVAPEALVGKLDDLQRAPEAESSDLVEFNDGRVFECASKPQWVGGEVVGRVWSSRDVTDRKRLEERLSYQAFHDSLTGLGNRALFQDHLEHAVARIERTRGHLAVLFVDLDNLKAVNDTLGHSSGDLLLQATAARLARCVRKSDTAARLGGDEFGVLVEEFADHGEVVKLVDRMLASAGRPVLAGGRALSATLSIGITFHRPGASTDQLLSEADRAMYVAKDRGGNQSAQFGDAAHVGAIATG